MKKGTQLQFAATLLLATLGAAPAAAQNGVETGMFWDHRPTFVFGDSKIELHARVQSDYLVRDESDPEVAALGFEDRLSMQRKRVGVEGELFNRVAFQVEGEIGDDAPWRDVYAEVRVHHSMRVRAGRFKVPFSLEQLTSGTDRDFISRSAAVSDLSPSRDFGFMLHGRLADRAVKYEAGVFETGAATRLWDAGAVRSYAGRVTIAPLEDHGARGSDALEISAAFLRSDLPEGRGGLSGHLVMGETFFRPMFVNGSRTLLGASMALNGRRAALRGELLRSLDTRLGQAVDGGDLSNLVANGGYIAGVWHLAALDGKRWGRAPFRAVDLTARFDRLSFGSAANGGEAYLNPRAEYVAPVGKNAWTMGLTWQPNRWVKVQANTVREQLVDRMALLTFGRTPLWSTVVRFQVAM